MAESDKMTDSEIRALIERLRATPNWLRQEYGSWKDATSVYDRAPFEAADALEATLAPVQRKCPFCQGTAKRYIPHLDGYMEEKCAACNGTGQWGPPTLAPIAGEDEDARSKRDEFCIWEDCDQEAIYCAGHAAEYMAPAIDALRAERDALKAALRELVAEAMHFAIMDRGVAKARAALAAPEDAP